MLEQWRPIKGFESAYEVSDQGRVRSLTTRDRYGAERPRREPMIIKATYAGNCWRISLCHKLRKRSATLHVLVAEAFLGPRPPGLECTHISGVKADNAVSNLAWMTRAENCALRSARDVAAAKAGIVDRLLRWSIPEPNTGCWLWLGAVTPAGYGTVTVGGEVLAAHRASYEAKYGPIPEGLYACHRCDQRSCINPDHLFPGDSRANQMDRRRKLARGDLVWQSVGRGSSK